MILVTGSNGQLGSELKLLLSTSEAVFVTSKDCDITSLDQIEKIISQNKITHIINCAAYTAVDLAEKEIEKAYLVNETGPYNLAVVSKRHDITLIHISTDYVFDGKMSNPIHEDHIPNPVSAYGKSKLAGENKIIEVGPKGIIIRTSWLYSSFGKNFLKTILKASEERESLKVVNDQIGTPTYAADLANAILKIIPKLGDIKSEIYNYSNEGEISWFDFALCICDLKKRNCKVYPIESSEYPTPTPRPAYSVLSKDKIKAKFNLVIPFWKDSLVTCLAKDF